MLISFGYEMNFRCPAATPMICQLDVHQSQSGALRYTQPFASSPETPSRLYTDAFGNRCRRLIAPPGDFVMSSAGVIDVSDRPEAIERDAGELPVGALPDDTLVYLAGSRYIETDKLSQIAWDLFGHVAPGWARVQAICDFVHQRIAFDYAAARSTRTAFEAYQEGVGVCRDFAHLAVALCRCMNIPARYANGYLGDIGVPVDPAPMDFNAWFEVYLDCGWRTFDARHNMPRIGRILVARGRDAADIPLVNSFGPHELTSFRVWTDEITADEAKLKRAS